MTERDPRPDNVINLNKFRKAKARDLKEVTAANNRVAHGRTKAEKAKDESERQKSDAQVDAHKLDTPDDPDGNTPA